MLPMNIHSLSCEDVDGSVVSSCRIPFSLFLSDSGRKETLELLVVFVNG